MPQPAQPPAPRPSASPTDRVRRRSSPEAALPIRRCTARLPRSGAAASRRRRETHR